MSPKKRQAIPTIAEVTADTITDEQIRELYDDGAISYDTLYRAVHRERLVGESHAAFKRSRGYRRGQCAEMWNARAKEGR